MISSYYIENKENYIKGFKCFLKAIDEALTDEEIKEHFKNYMLYNKNVKTDLRFNFWKDIIKESLKGE